MTANLPDSTRFGQGPAYPLGDWHDGRVQADELARFLADHAPFDALDEDGLRTVAAAAEVERHPAGAQIIDAFAEPTHELFVVLDGHVQLWGRADSNPDGADETLGPGGVFGYSAMLTQRSVGPRAVAAEPATVARIPASAVNPAFSSASGARFLAEHLSQAPARGAALPSYGVVDELIVSAPVVVDRSTPIADVARAMTEHGNAYAAVDLGSGQYGLITDSLLRRRVIVGGLPPSAPVTELTDRPAPTTQMGESAAEALITLLDEQAEFLLVVDRAGRLRGAVAPTDFVISTATAGVALRQQLARAGSVDDLVHLGRRAPALLDDLLARGLAANKVIAVYSATIDAMVRRALVLTFARHPDLDLDAFTWLSLGSNGRREAVLSSDVDSAVTFAAALGPADQARYRAAFAEVNTVLDAAGVGVDEHGATAAHLLFARTDAQWRAAAEGWLADPAENKGAIMMSLLVDGRPIHGDPGLPAVSEVFTHLRRHPGTMRLLLHESLSHRARLRSLRDVLSRRGGTFDLKAHALVPILNIARWAALSVGSSELATTSRLQAAAGSTMLPGEQAGTLVEVFEVLQRLRLRYQLHAYERGHRPSDIVTMQLLSPIDRSVVAQAVREVAAVQRRMENLAQVLPPDDWTTPEPG